MISEDTRTEYFINAIYNTAREKLQSGRFDEVNQTLGRISVNHIPTSFMFAYLDVTKKYKEHLPNRPHFYNQAREMIDQRNELEDLALLKTLE